MRRTLARSAAAVAAAAASAHTASAQTAMRFAFITSLLRRRVEDPEIGRRRTRNSIPLRTRATHLRPGRRDAGCVDRKRHLHNSGMARNYSMGARAPKTSAAERVVHPDRRSLRERFGGLRNIPPFLRLV